MESILVPQLNTAVYSRRHAHCTYVTCLAYVRWYVRSRQRRRAHFCSGYPSHGSIESDVRPTGPYDPLHEAGSCGSTGPPTGRLRPPCGLKERKGKPRMPPATMQVLSVTDAATVLGIAPRTVRRWLHEGQLVGRKIVTSWVVLCPASSPSPGTGQGGPSCPSKRSPPLWRCGSACSSLDSGSLP
jgi:hypothetical protein